jgi:hypothetical protein
MIFTYKEEKGGFVYMTEDFVGKVKLKSKKRLTPALLDSCVLRLSNMESGTGTFKDEKNNNDIEFEFQRSEIWEDDLEDNK